MRPRARLARCEWCSSLFSNACSPFIISFPLQPTRREGVGPGRLTRVVDVDGITDDSKRSFLTSRLRELTEQLGFWVLVGIVQLRNRWNVSHVVAT